jgi:hypothetical protein
MFENADGTCSQAKLKKDATAISIFSIVQLKIDATATLPLIPSQYS